MSKKLEFPKGFFWGAATASFQVEGGIENTDWSYEGRRGKVPLANDSIDHFNKYEEDFDIAKELGHNCHRLSIEWARIEPHEGEFDKEALAHYKKVLKALHKRKLTPFVTIWHFTLPLWLYEEGGVLSPEFPHYFARYAGVVAEHLGDQCVHFATINEPNVVTSNGYIRGEWPPFKKAHIIKSFKVLKQLKRAHILAYHAIKDKDLACEVGIVKDNIYIHSSKNPLMFFASRLFRWFWNFYFLNRIKDHIDSIGLNYYFHYHFGHRRTERKRSDMGWEIYPEGIYYVLKELKRYHKPVFVAEAGIADREDKDRGQYIKDLVYWTHKAIEDGVPVKGFMYWSLLDNFEWALGYDKRFGLVEIDYKTGNRKIRDSAYLYKEICENNALTLKD